MSLNSVVLSLATVPARTLSETDRSVADGVRSSADSSTGEGGVWIVGEVNGCRDDGCEMMTMPLGPTDFLPYGKAEVWNDDVERETSK